jgi:hypothetical protein
VVPLLKKSCKKGILLFHQAEQIVFDFLK